MGLILDRVAIAVKEVVLLRPFKLSIGPGEIVTLMGPSGSGKSSLLAFIAGDLPEPMSGSGAIILEGRDITLTPPEQRRIGRLFQDDLLFPHLTVGENLLFGMAKGSRDGRLRRMREALAAAELEGFEDRPPHTLSGGERSRVSLFRSLLAEPQAMLLDEPFAKLDTELRNSLRGFVFEHLREKQIPSLLVTHDRADRPKGGRLLQIGSGGEVLDA